MSTERATGKIDTGTTSEELLAKMEELESRLDSVEKENQELREENQQLRDRLDEVETKQAGFGKAISSNQNRIEDIESGGSVDQDANGGVKPNENQPSAENIGKFSPLGQVVNLPEHATDSLSRNQERARFVAKDVREYADMRKGELVMSTGDIKRVLSAKEEKSIHWETVSRVVDFLDTLGNEDTTVKDKRGTIVCFDPDAVAQWSKGRQTHAVVSGERGTV